MVNNKYNPFIFVASVFVCFLSTVVIVGWLLDIVYLKSVFPGYASMKFNTAVCLNLLGFSLILQLKYSINGPVILARTLALLVFLIGAVSLSEDLFSYNFGIDQLLFFEYFSMEDSIPAPGRMSGITGICFILIGLAFQWLNSRKKWLRVVAQFFLNLSTFLAFIAIIGYIFNVPPLYKISFISSMALHTALSFFILSMVASLINPSLGVTGLFIGKRIGNIMARKLFWQMTIAVLVLAYVRILTHRYGILSVEFGITLFALSFILASLFLIWRSSIELNIVEAKKEELENSLSRVESFLDSTPDPIVIVDDLSKIRLTNKQAEKIFGYTKHELKGQYIDILIPGRYKNRHTGHISHFFNDHITRAMGSGLELFAVKKNGIEFPVEISLSPIQSDEGLYVSAAIRDISGRKEAQEKLRNYSILESKSKEMEQFVYVASHDLREPLLTIQKFSELLVEDYADILKENAKFYTDTINSAANRLDLLIKGLLDYSRLSQIKQFQSVDCNKLIKLAAADLEYQITLTKTTIDAGELPVIKAYPLELQLMFQNLISNAIKFTPADVSPKITISAVRVSNGWQFAVSDNGIGIAGNDREKIFLIFHRLHHKNQYEGTGLGLALCKKIAELHNGTIWVEPNADHGSTFYFTLLTDQT